MDVKNAIKVLNKLSKVSQKEINSDLTKMEKELNRSTEQGIKNIMHHFEFGNIDNPNDYEVCKALYMSLSEHYGVDKYTNEYIYWGTNNQYKNPEVNRMISKIYDYYNDGNN